MLGGRPISRALLKSLVEIPACDGITPSISSSRQQPMREPKLLRLCLYTLPKIPSELRGTVSFPEIPQSPLKSPLTPLCQRGDWGDLTGQGQGTRSEISVTYFGNNYTFAVQQGAPLEDPVSACDAAGVQIPKT
jgi:hypothetical protein